MMVVSTPAAALAPQPVVASTAAAALFPKPLTVDETIAMVAKKYGVQPTLMRSIIMCESSFNQNAVNDNPGVEYSVGLAQINLLAHTDITKDQALDPGFSIEFMGKHLANGKGQSMWVTCYKKATQ